MLGIINITEEVQSKLKTLNINYTVISDKKYYQHDILWICGEKHILHCDDDIYVNDLNHSLITLLKLKKRPLKKP